jgi:hypothetical protein
VTSGLTLLEFFDADISGRDFAQGKPHPEIFLTGAKELGVPLEECFVVEDAVSGIQAAKAGGMAALGLSRAGDEELLAAAEPDVLVTSLDDVDLDALAEGRLAAEGRLIAADHARRGVVVTDGLRVAAARAGRELELYRRRCLLLVDVRHHPRSQSCPRSATPVVVDVCPSTRAASPGGAVALIGGYACVRARRTTLPWQRSWRPGGAIG